MKITFGRASDDPEKLVTPGIVFCTKRSDGLAVYLIALGWWDYHLSFLFKRHLSPKNKGPNHG